MKRKSLLILEHFKPLYSAYNLYILVKTTKIMEWFWQNQKHLKLPWPCISQDSLGYATITNKLKDLSTGIILMLYIHWPRLMEQPLPDSKAEEKRHLLMGKRGICWSYHVPRRRGGGTLNTAFVNSTND